MDFYEPLVLLILIIAAVVTIYSIMSQRLRKVEEEMNNIKTEFDIHTAQLTKNIIDLTEEISYLTNTTYKLATDTTLKTYNPWNRVTGVKIAKGLNE